MNCAPKMAVKQQESTSFFSKTVSSVTNFFARSPPPTREYAEKALYTKCAMKSPPSPVSMMQSNTRKREQLE
jgi:hypothetical protein